MLTQTNQPRGCLRKPNLVPIFRGQLKIKHTNMNSNYNHKHKQFSTCGSLILLYSAASALSSSHHILNSQITKWAKPSQNSPNHISTSAHSSRGASTHFFPTAGAVAQEVRSPPRPTGNWLIWPRTTTGCTGASGLHIYTATHIHIYTNTNRNTNRNTNVYTKTH